MKHVPEDSEVKLPTQAVEDVLKYCGVRYVTLWLTIMGYVMVNPVVGVDFVYLSF